MNIQFSTSARRRTECGSSLLLVIWAIMMASLAVLSLLEFLDTSVEEDLQAGKRFHARLLAESAMVLARHPQIRPTDPILSQPASHIAHYQVAVTNEGTRIAVNHLASNPILRRATSLLFERWGLDIRNAAEIVDAIADWTDADDMVRDQGAEWQHYTRLMRPDYPLDRHFRSLEELLFVRNFEIIETVQPHWRDYFTLHGDGKIDVNKASPLLLEILFDVEPHQALRVTDARLGPDGLENTEDDVRLGKFEEIAELLDMPDGEFEEVLPQLTLDHPVRRIVSLAQVGDTTVTLMLIEGAGVRELLENNRVPSTVQFPVHDR